MKSDLLSKGVRRFLNVIYIVFVLTILVGVLLGPGVDHNNFESRKSAIMQTTRTIGLCLFQYSQDHKGHYPEGKTSTEIFQHLIDEKYITDPEIFYVVMPVKVRAQSTQLRLENVCWDVTCGVDSSAPDGLPLVFLTGYKVTYQAGARAEPIEQLPKTWIQWWDGSSRPPIMKTFIAVCYKDISARAIKADENGSIPNFIPADFDPKGKTYRQLTP